MDFLGGGFQKVRPSNGVRKIPNCRPTHIDLSAEGGLRGTVVRRVYLRDLVEYCVTVKRC